MKTDYQWCFENSEEAAELICSQSKRIEELEAKLAEAKKQAVEDFCEQYGDELTCDMTFDELEKIVSKYVSRI